MFVIINYFIATQYSAVGIVHTLKNIFLPRFSHSSLNRGEKRNTDMVYTKCAAIAIASLQTLTILPNFATPQLIFCQLPANCHHGTQPLAEWQPIANHSTWPLFRGDQVSSSIFSIAKFMTRLLSTCGLRILFDPIYNCGTDQSPALHKSL